MKGLKPILAMLLAFALIALWSYLNIEDYEIEDTLEGIDDTKFPISEYLYQDYTPSTQTTQIEPPKVKIPAEIDNQPNQPVTRNPSISELFDDVVATTTKNVNEAKEKAIDKTEKITKDIFTIEDNEARDEIKRKRQAILATRQNKTDILSKNKNATNVLETEYGVDKFSNLDIQDKASNEHKLYRTLSAMKMIPAILLTNISSDIGGKVIAQVEEDIYAEMGKAILIPKGSKALGFYKSDNKIGEYRLNVAWTRILTPQGVNIMLTEANGADLAGAMGLIGDLDSKYWQRYGIPLALSTISNGLIIAINNVTTKSSTSNLSSYMTASLMENMQADISDIMAEIIKEQIKIQPTIRIEKGSRIFITSNKDIFFPIPKNGEVMARFFDEVKLTKGKIQ